LPPTDLMKILSRTDRLIYLFQNYLKNAGFSTEQGNDIINPFPYTCKLVLGEKPLICLGLSICFSTNERTTKYFLNNFKYNGFWFITPGKGSVSCIDDVCKACTANNYVSIYSKNCIENVHIIKDSPLEMLNISKIEKNEIPSVLAVNLETFAKSSLTLAFMEPARIKYLSFHHMILEYYGNCFYISKEPLIHSIRRILVEKHIFNSQLSLSKLQYSPLVEVLDPYSIVIPQNFNDKCIEMLSLNITSNAINTIIRVYSSRVTKVYLDDVEYDYKHNVVRVALEPLTKVVIKLCLYPKI